MGWKLVSKNFKFAKKILVALFSYWQRFLRSSGAAALLGFLPPWPAVWRSFLSRVQYSGSCYFSRALFSIAASYNLRETVDCRRPMGNHDGKWTLNNLLIINVYIRESRNLKPCVLCSSKYETKYWNPILYFSMYVCMFLYLLYRSRQLLNHLSSNLSWCFEMVSDRELSVLVTIGCIFSELWHNKGGWGVWQS